MRYSVGMGLDGPSRTVIVEPAEPQVPTPVPEREPAREPAEPERTPERTPEKIPA
jgi:hypothetical protein